MKKSVPENLINELNVEVLKRLEGASCHSDIVEPIEKIFKQYEGVASFCPDGKSFSYCCWYVNNNIFAYATGMRNVTLKLAQNEPPVSRKQEGSCGNDIATKWHSVAYNSTRLNELVASAYNIARRAGAY